MKGGVAENRKGAKYETRQCIPGLHLLRCTHVKAGNYRDGRPRLFVAVRRALLGHCPNCGKGRLFRSYLKQVEHCAACGEPFGHIRSDDAAPWLTILIVGHIVVPVALSVETSATLPSWVSMSLWPLLALALSLILLPRAKGLFLSFIWHTRSPGSELE